MLTAEAQADLRTVLRISPSHADAYKSQAMLTVTSGDRTMAIHFLTQALKHRPNDLDALIQRAELLEQVKRTIHSVF